MIIPLIKSASEIPTKEISLTTRMGTPISNVQCYGISQVNRNQFEDFNKKWRHLLCRTNFSGIYNCHGMTFASRRTCILKDEMIDLILQEDDYKEIDRKEVIEGDIIVYLQNGLIIHSGVILNRSLGLTPAKVLSKCGCYGEYLHNENDRIYEYDMIKFYRINDEDTGIN